MENNNSNFAQQQAPEAQKITLQIPDASQFEQFARLHEEEAARKEAQAPVQTAPEMESTQPAESKKKSENILARLFRTRIKVSKGNTSIMNVSALFMIASVLSAIWLVAGGAIAALLLGYTFSVEKDSPEFQADLKKIVKEAGANVQNAVDSLKD